MISKLIRMLALGGLVIGAPVSAEQDAASSGLNKPPFVKGIPNKRAQEGKRFVLKPPLSRYIKDPEGDQFRISVEEDSWLIYDKMNDTLWGTPRVYDYTAVVKVRARDAYGWGNRRHFGVTIKPLEPDDRPIFISKDLPFSADQNIIAAISETGRFVSHVFQEDNYGGIQVQDVAAGQAWTVYPQEGEPQSQFVSNPSISADGRTVAFAEAAGDEEVRVLWIADTDPLEVELVQAFEATLGSNARAAVVSLAADGGVVVFEDGSDILVAEVYTDRSKPITNAGSPSLSFDGSRIAYASEQHVWVRTLDFGGEEIETTERIDIGPGSDPVVSTDGRFVAFEDKNDTNGKSDIYVSKIPEPGKDPEVYLASVDAENHTSGHDSLNPSLSGNGSLIVFDDFVPYTGQRQILARRLGEEGQPKGKLRMVSVNNEGDPGKGVSTQPALSEDGRFVAFTSEAINLTEDANPGLAVFWVPAFPPHAPVVNFPPPPPEPAAGPQR